MGAVWMIVVHVLEPKLIAKLVVSGYILMNLEIWLFVVNYYH